MKTALTYDDVLLVPQYSDIHSRLQVNLTNNLGELEFALPLIASPMDTVSEFDMAYGMWKNLGVAIIHRYNTVEEQCAIVPLVAYILPLLTGPPHRTAASLSLKTIAPPESPEIEFTFTSIWCAPFDDSR